MQQVKAFVLMLFLANIGFWVWELNFSPDLAVGVLPAIEPPFREAGKQLQLIGEISVLPREILSATQATISEESEPLGVSGASVPEVADAVVPVPWCAETGVLAKVDDAVALLAEWEKVGGVGEIASDQEVISTTWWVYLPRFASEAEARAVLSELQQKKIDSYYMRNGDLAGGISLGVFSREAGARKFQNELRQKGYATELHEVPRVEERSRLYLILESGAPAANADAERVLAKFNSIHTDEIPCK